MNSEIESKTGRASAQKVGGMRVSAPDHSVPVVRKEHRRPSADKEEEMNEDERQLEKLEQLEVEKQTRLAEGERLARMQEIHPKKEPHNNFKQNQNIHVGQPILHNHTKSGASALA
ncbi:hypothetical protein BGZ76_002161 [Entomortierella beljakovae]|nr:hypothetical protein BGZ76_002161 [Entomortierella beljakovae]